MNMEFSSSQGLFKSSQYAAMNDLLFQQFGFQVLANNIHEENTDTYPILVQSVLRESDVEIWGGFCVRAYIVKLDFQKTPGQPEMCLAILLKNKYTPDVKRLEAPFTLQAFHLQWIQNVLHADEDVDVGNAKEIPFIAMYDALELSETERTTESLKSWKDIDQSLENDARLENDGKIITRDEMESMDNGNQSIMREMSHDLSPTVPSQVCQEVSVYTDDVNNQAEGFATDLKEVKETEGRTNEEERVDVSQDDGNLKQTTDKLEDFESSKNFASIPNMDADMKGIHTELTTKDNNLLKNHDTVAATEKAKEMPSTDIEGASYESHHAVTEGDSNKELPPQKRSKRRGPAIKIELQEKKEGKKRSKLERVEKRKKKVKKQIHKCEDCGTNLSSEQEYSLHMTQHQPEARKQTFQCRICEREFGRAMALKDHEKSEHPGERKDTKDVQGTVYQCEDCGIDFRSKREYSKHASKHRQEARKRCIQCPICGTQFDREIDLRNHEKLEHPGKRPYVCETCGASFQHSTLLRDHTKLVHRTTFFHCDLCDKIFKRKHSLKTHKDIKHLNIWKYQCDICGLKTTLKYEYMVHLLVHSKERNFTCEVCGKAFKTKRTLNGHKTSHSDKRPYSCDVCGKGFLRREHLMEHLVVHTKENTFLCEDCGKSFSNKTNLYVHRRQHTGIRPYVCTVCGQGFHRRKALGKHMEKLHSDSAAEANPSENVNA